MFYQLDGDYDSFPFDGIFLDIIFDYGYRKCSLFGIIFLPYWRIQLDLHDELYYCDLSYFPN